MKLTTTQIMAAISRATLHQLPERALHRIAGGYTLVPDHGYWMDKAIKHLSSEREKVIAGLSSSRLHSLEAQGHIQIESIGRGFTYCLPEEQLGQCWFRTRSILRDSGIPDYGDKPVTLNITPIIESAVSMLNKEFSIQEVDDYGQTRWHIVCNSGQEPQTND